MRAQLLAVIALFAIAIVPAQARADCAPSWKVGPFWQDFFTNGANSTIGCATLWDPDGAGPGTSHLVISGNFSTIQGLTVGGLAQLDPLTGQWAAIPSPPAGQIDAMTVYNNELIVAGTFTTAGGAPANNIAAWDGSSWHALGGGITSAVYVRALTVYNGQLIAGGTFTTAGGAPASNIASWDGSSWHAMGSGVTGSYVTALTNWQGALIVGGVFNTAGGVTVSNVASWNGSSWAAMGSGLVGGIAAFQGYNGIMYAAVQTTVSGSPASYIAGWNGSGWSSSPTYVRVTLNALTYYNGSLYTGGVATTGTGGATNGVYLYDGSLHALLGGITGTVYDLTPFNGDLVATGAFTAADGRLANRIARWDGTNWGTFGGGNSASVLAMTGYGSRIIAGGDFHQYLRTGPEAHHVVSVNDGAMSPLGSGMDGNVDELLSYSTGTFVNRFNQLVAGGSFTHAGGVVTNNVARWTEQSLVVFPAPSWAAMGLGFDGPVYALERFNNQVYAGGSFSFSGAVVVSEAARFDETTKAWEGLFASINGPVYAMKTFGSYLYVGGAFTTVGGIATGGLARFDGTNWSQVGGTFGGTVYALEVHNNHLVIGGLYPGYGGSPNIAQYDGTNYSLLGGGGTNAVVRTLHSTGSRLYVGGDFTTLGGVSVNRLGYWDGSWHDADGGADNSVYALSNHHNLVNVGGVFNNVQFGGFVGSPTWALYDETGVPQFYSQPFSVTANAGDNVSFTAVPDSGYIGLTLQWYHGATALVDGPTGTGSTISGANSEVLNVTNVGPADLGGYSMVAAEGCGADTSAVATLNANAGVGGARAPVTLFAGIAPNPASGATRCEYSLARGARVRLAVRDVAGRTVRTLDLGAQSAGPHQAAWDATDAGGARVRAGVYFLGLEVDGRAIGTKRLAIVR